MRCRCRSHRCRSYEKCTREVLFAGSTNGPHRMLILSGGCRGSRVNGVCRGPQDRRYTLDGARRAPRVGRGPLHKAIRVLRQVNGLPRFLKTGSPNNLRFQAGCGVCALRRARVISSPRIGCYSAPKRQLCSLQCVIQGYNSV